MLDTLAEDDPVPDTDTLEVHDTLEEEEKEANPEEDTFPDGVPVPVIDDDPEADTEIV